MMLNQRIVSAIREYGYTIFYLAYFVRRYHFFQVNKKPKALPLDLIFRLCLKL